MSVRGEKVFAVELTQFNRTDEEKELMAAGDVDIAVKLTLNEMRFIFLNAWLNRLLVFPSFFAVFSRVVCGVSRNGFFLFSV